MIIITSTFTADVMHPYLTGLLQQFCQHKTTFIYNQIFQQLLLPTSECHLNKEGLNVLLIRLNDLLHYSSDDPSPAAESFIAELSAAIATAQESMHVPLLILFTPTPNHRQQETEFYRNIEYHIQQRIHANKNISILSSSTILEHSPSQSIDAPFTEKYGHIPYSAEFYQVLSTLIARKYSLFTRKPYKAIVLDCDGTLWKGVIEEDGITKVTIDHYDAALQQFFIQCYQAGFLLCLCSKNNETTLLSAFATHPHMVLNIQQHICTYRINWQSKSENITSIAHELGLSLDSFIFIDENKLECAEVKAHLPEILVVELPKIRKNRLPYLQHIWAFDYFEISQEDQSRTQFYQQNRLRQTLKSGTDSYLQFIKKLKIKTVIQRAKLTEYERIIQLSQRTNQFNIAPNTLSRTAYYQSILTGEPLCSIIKVSDKYGDYGMVGVTVYSLVQPILTVHALFISCRILGYGIEYEILNYLSQIAHNQACTHIHIPFHHTAKNIPALEFLKKISNGVSLNACNMLILNTADIRNLDPNFISTPAPKIGNAQPVKTNQLIAHDYLLDIAKDALKNKKKSTSQDSVITAQTIKIHLIGLCKRHDLIIAKSNLALIDLGLNSLRAVLLASEIFRTYHIEINPFELLTSTTTVNTLVQTLLNRLFTPQPSIQVHNHPKPQQYAIQLSNAQKRLWYDEKISEGTSRNNLFIAYQLPNDVNELILEHAFNTLIARHDALRFSFHAAQDDPLITCHPAINLAFKITQHSVLDDLALIPYIEQFHQKPFDLSHPPLLRVAIAKSPQRTILLICLHHIIHDGWSFNILCHELSILYHAYSHQVDHHLPAITFSYTDFIAWQQHTVTEKMLSTQKEYWASLLHKLPVLEFIYDKPRKKYHEPPPNKRIDFQLDQQTTQQLKQLAARYHITLYDLLMTAFGLLLSHYTNQPDVSFLTAVSGRHHPNVHHVVGFFVNLLLVRFQMSADVTLSQLLKNNKTLLNTIFAHQELPLHDILQATGETVDSQIHAFSQAGFIFQNYPIAQLTLHHTVCQRVYANNGTTVLYDSSHECRFGNLVCFMQEIGPNLCGVMEYNHSLFHNKTIVHVIRAFKVLLKNMAQDPSGPARAIPLLTNSQKNMLFKQWNPQVISPPIHASLTTLFAEQVAKHPNALAVKYHHQILTYSDLDQRANQLAHHLKTLGLKRENPVGILLKKGVEPIIAMLGIIKAGGCYVPLEKDLPSARIRYIIMDTHLAYLITDQDITRYIDQEDSPIRHVITLDHLNIHNAPTYPLFTKTQPQQLAYIIYTSGTTGNLKGVMLEQEGILRLVKSPNYLNITAKDRFAQTSNMLFDAATLEIWGALLNGASLVILDKETLLDASSFEHFLREEQITILFLTTQLFHSYAFTQPNLFTNLNYMIVGGETVLAEAVQRVFKQPHPPKHFINGYGPTENTTFSTTYTVNSLDDIVDPIPIGTPISGTKAYVLNHHFNPMPIGAPGTLYVGGQGLARKYLHQTTLNQEKFIEYENERLFNTGDIVAWQAQGYLRYLGREDDQVKLNGYRIELNEIETQLKTHPYVEQAVVLINSHHQQTHLAAYVSLKNSHHLSELNL